MKNLFTLFILMLVSCALLFAQNKKSQKISQAEANSEVYNFNLEFFSSDNLDLSFDISDESSRGSFYALFIGVEDYASDKFKDLDQPIRDATSLMKVLTEQYVFSNENVKLLPNPKKDEIVAELEILKAKLTPNDNLLIFYAGHGTYDEKLKLGYWIPADAGNSPSTWFANTDLQNYINGIDTRHTLVIADACFSSSIFKDQTRALDNLMETANDAIQQLYNDKSRRAIASGNLQEVPDKSIFIEYLVKELKKNKDIYLPSYRILPNFREVVLNQTSGKQNPRDGVIEGTKDEGGDFIFIRKK